MLDAIRTFFRSSMAPADAATEGDDPGPDLRLAACALLLELAHADAEFSEDEDLWQFTNLIDQSYSLGQKTVLAEIMWGLVYSDGDLAEKESYLMRKISNLLHLQPDYLAEARKRVDARKKVDRID
jgi:uncharacterized tellurite resistance protein B-like protein